MASKALEIASEESMVALGASVYRAINSVVTDDGITIFLEGDLGAGKTSFCRGLVREAGHAGAVKSPTYTLVETYDMGGRTCYHMDLYRLTDPEELEFLGVREFFNENSVCLVEWPEKGSGFLAGPDLAVEIVALGESRQVSFTAYTESGKTIINNLDFGG